MSQEKRPLTHPGSAENEDNRMRKNNLDKVTELRHQLHKCPELSMQEQGTIRIIRRFLEENTSLEIVDKGTWLYAVKRGSC